MGLAKNIKNLGRGHAWIIATAQQTLTEDDPRAATNTAKLFKLKDRFPVSIDLEASDIKEICFRRLLGKSPAGESALNGWFERYGSQLRLCYRAEKHQVLQIGLGQRNLLQVLSLFAATFRYFASAFGSFGKNPRGRRSALSHQGNPRRFGRSGKDPQGLLTIG